MYYNMHTYISVYIYIYDTYQKKWYIYIMFIHIDFWDAPPPSHSH